MGGVWTRRGICGDENRHEGVCVWGGGGGGDGVDGKEGISKGLCRKRER